MKQMQDVRNEIVPLIRDVCVALAGHANENEVALLLGTAAGESSLIHRVQLGGGPARGIWQMEPETARDIFRNYLSRKHNPLKDDLWFRLIYVWFHLSSIPFWIPVDLELAIHLEEADDFACAMARIHYLRDPDPIPDTLEGQAAYWYKVYQTPGGAHKPEWYIKQWHECGCEELLAL